MAEQQQFVDTSQSGDSYRYAGFLFRLIGYIIDTIFITLVALVLAFAAAIIWNLENQVILEVAYTASGLITIVYVVAFWAVAGGTPGKLMLGMRIVGPDGSVNGIGWGRAILRLIASLVSAIPCYLGYVWIIIDRDKQGWHDKIARTWVVNV